MRNQLARHPREAVAGLITLALGAALVQYARGLPEMPGGYPGPGLFPTIVGVLFCVFGLALIVQAASGHVAPMDADAVEHGERWRSIANVVVIVAAVPVYVVLSEYVGFVITMALIAFGIMVHLGVRLVLALPIAVLVAPAVSYVFGTVLRVPLPRGPFGW